MVRAARSTPVAERRIHAESDLRPCDWPGCTESGEYRAPKSPRALNEYHWFCLIHVRAYNASWNYYAGMTEDEIEADRRRDTVWDRPTWPLGDDGAQGAFPFHDAAAGTLYDDFGLFEDAEPASRRCGDGGARHADPDGSRHAALAVFGLAAPVTVDEVKTRYKALVKRHHPDANGGTEASEEKIKEINEAYHTLINFLAP